MSVNNINCLYSRKWTNKWIIGIDKLKQVVIHARMCIAIKCSFFPPVLFFISCKQVINDRAIIYLVSSLIIIDGFLMLPYCTMCSATENSDKKETAILNRNAYVDWWTSPIWIKCAHTQQTYFCWYCDMTPER